MEPMSQPNVAPKGKRFAADLIDLVVIPVILGFVLGILFGGMREGFLKNILLLAFNIGWVIVRDVVFSPGRKLIGLKLVSLDSDKVSIKQGFVRNAFILVPFVLLPGYICEFARVFIPKLLWRRVTYILAVVLVLLLGFVSQINMLIIVIVMAMLALPVFFFVTDKDEKGTGDRMMDVFAHTRVVQI